MSPTSRPVAIVVGYVVRYPLGGMTWVFLNYLLGLRDLGFEPVFMEASDWQPCCFDVPNNAMTADPSYGIAYLKQSLADAGLEGTRWWYRDDDRDHGMSRDEAVATLSESAVLLNMSASCSAPEFLRAPRRVLIDADAPFTQIRLADPEEDEWLEIINSYDVLATYAINLAEGRTTIPDCGRRWLGMAPPIHLASWPVSSVPAGSPWTTVTSWSAYGSRWWDLEEYRQKEPVFQALRDLPAQVDVPIELAITDDAPRSQFLERGWRVAEPRDVTRTPSAFAAYVRASRGELCVTKEAYVKAQTGALNERSLAYLATGRPVACFDTGLGWLPTGEGLLPFSDAHGAARAIAAAEADVDLHAKAARALVEKHFSAGPVLADLLRAADVPVPTTALS